MHRHRSLGSDPPVAQGSPVRGRGARRVGGKALPEQKLRVPIRRRPGTEDLPLPARATPGSAGFDLHAAVDADAVLAPGQRALIPTGVSIAVPPGYEAQVRPRSGLALEHGILLPNAPGTIDSDYRGEVKVILCNAGDEAFTVHRGDRIAQLVITPVVAAEWEERSSLDETRRAAGGFGHSGGRGGKAAEAPRGGGES